MEDQQVLETLDDVEMMKRGHLWPHLLLPLKRSREGGGFPETGYLSNPCAPWVITLGTIWGPIPGEPEGTIEYTSPEEAVADGWRVD